MASRQNSSQMLNNQSSSSNSTNSTNAKEKTGHAKSDTKNKHDKNSSSTPGHIPMSTNSIINSMNNMSKRKGTSFQITSVSVSSGNNQQQQQQNQQQQRNSSENNNGDDSADDLDESHTDDNISRITDYETPSFSEDTFSREDVFFTQPNAFGTAPVIPTSSQYGLAIVGPDLGGNGSNLTDVHVSVTDAGINIMGQIPNKQDVDHKNERFKVVKIESTEPFKRGRWMCMDYLDHTTLQAQDDGTDGTPTKEDGDEHTAIKTKDIGSDLDGGVDGNESMMNDNNGDHHQHHNDQMNDNEAFDQEVLRAEMMNHHGDGITSSKLASQTHHTVASIPTHNEHQTVVQNQAQTMPRSQFEQLITQENSITQQSSLSNAINVNDSPPNHTENTSSSSSSDTLPRQASQINQANVGSSIQANQLTTDNNSFAMNHPHHAHSMTPDMIQRSLHQETQQQQIQQQGVTLPTNILMQNLGIDQQQQPQSQQQQPEQQSQSINASSNINNNLPPTLVSPMSSKTDNNNLVDQQQQQSQQDLTMTSQFHNNQTQIGGNGDNNNIQQQMSEIDQQLSVTTSTNDNNNIINSSVSDNNNINNNNSNNNDGTQNTSSPSSSAGLGTVADGGGALSVASELSSNSNNTTAIGDDGQSLNEDSESASGTSAVAIDNKIEQAMDLVKSHLMFAVREEVEVLKEKIAELMDRINQLEVENTILKANASQETLSQLSTAATTASTQSTIQTSPAQPQSSPALSKINIDVSVLQAANAAAAASPSSQTSQQPSTNPPTQNPTATS